MASRTVDRRPETHRVGAPRLRRIDDQGGLEPAPEVAQIALDVAQALASGVVGVGAAGKLEAFRLELFAPRLELRETRRGHVVRVVADRAIGQRLVGGLVVLLDERAAHEKVPAAGSARNPPVKVISIIVCCLPPLRAIRSLMSVHRPSAPAGWCRRTDESD